MQGAIPSWAERVPITSSAPLSDFLDWQLVKMSAKLSFKFKDSLQHQIDEIRHDQRRKKK